MYAILNSAVSTRFSICLFSPIERKIAAARSTSDLRAKEGKQANSWEEKWTLT